MNIADLHYKFLSTRGVSTDTRTLKKGELFFALSGENFNGNKFAHDALNKGADFIVIDDESFDMSSDTRIILVKDALVALQQLANYHRKYLGLPIIALTGSNGKTTTKNLIERVLSQQYQVYATIGNLNNHIGVPLTLLSLTAEHDFGIIEMGANHIGEIELLCKIAEPNYGYITNFGKAHLEGFGSIEGVIKAKSELYNYLAEHRGEVFVYDNDKKQKELTEKQGRITFGSGASYDFELISSQPKLHFKYKNNTIRTDLVGDYNFVNCIAALTIGEYFGVPAVKAIRAISTYHPENNRSEIRVTKINTLLLDAYNANPTSVKAAIENFMEVEHPNKKMILGDMFELGSYAKFEHQAVVDLLKEETALEVYLIGENYYATDSSSLQISKFKNYEDFIQKIKSEPIEGAYVLIKGSRGMALERLVEFL